MEMNWRKIEEKWRRLWDQSHVFEADVTENRPKCFITVAYPYPNSPQHIGHGRTYTLADVHARYRRMRGYNVLLPMGFHYTGTPILAMYKRLASSDQELVETFTKIYKVPEETLKDFTEPTKIARYFHEEIKQGMKEMGFSIDWRREFTTIDPQYCRFIEWQFRKLHEKGFITQGSHLVGWCPNCGNPVGQHDTIGDLEPEIGEFIAIKFLFNGYFMPAATLRPETIFGVTNIWLNPKASYVKAKVDGEKWIVSQESVEKLRYLNRKVSVEENFRGMDLIGKWAKNPTNEASILILPAAFVDPKNGTGVVMSVPGHAPYDYQALEDLRGKSEDLAKYGVASNALEAIKAISIIQLEGYSDLPALDVLKKAGIKSQNDPKLEEATKEVYSHEFHSGLMKANTMEYAGMPVVKAKEKITEKLLKKGQAAVIYEILNRPVVCRCGTECVVKIFENQWFINYGNTDWKELAHTCLKHMSILPEELRPEFEYAINWLRQKACARKSGLGTALPWDKDWIIESLSDSVIYMVYYLIAKYVNKSKIPPNLLTDSVFNYVLLSEGNLDQAASGSGIDDKILEKMREEMKYFYPLDSRHSGRDLIPNHLSFFIFNHVAIFPRELWPHQIVVNGSVLMEGKKMSKSLGNIIPLREAISIYGADPLRLAVLATAELSQDADFSSALAKSLRERLERFYSFALDIIKLREEMGEGELATEDKWMLSRLHRYIKAATEAMDELRSREAIHQVLYMLDQDVQWYMRRISSDLSPSRKKVKAKVLNEVLKARIRLLAPFTPYICEEIWQKMGGKDFISTANWPEYDERKVDVNSEKAEEIILGIVEDTSNLLKATKIKPKRICYYAASPTKWKIYLKAMEEADKGILSTGELMKKLVQDPAFSSEAKKLVKWIERISTSISKLASEERKRRLSAGTLDELKVLKEATGFLERDFNAKVEIYMEFDEKRYDPKDRAKNAEPYRPAIYLE